MPDPHRLERELRDVLSKPRYSAILAKQTEFWQQPVTAASLAKQTVDRIMRDSPFEGEVTVEDLRGGCGVELYRGLALVGPRGFELRHDPGSILVRPGFSRKHLGSDCQQLRRSA
jgi:hypothetical protein